MGCRCANYDFIEQKTEYKAEDINKELNNNNDDLVTVNKQLIKEEEEIDTSVIGYPELVFNLINQIRKDPKEYANTIEESMNYIVEEKNYMIPLKTKIIFKNKIKVALVRGKEAFEEAAEELRKMEPMEPLEFREDNCLTLPDDIEDYDNPYFLKNKVKEKMDNNIYINVFYKERVNVPDISVLLNHYYIYKIISFKNMIIKDK